MANSNNFLDNLDNFYDYGWNARVRDEPYDSTKGRNWRDGWKDCDEAPMEDRLFLLYKREK